MCDLAPFSKRSHMYICVMLIACFQGRETVILLKVFFASEFHLLSLLDARHNTREENNIYNSSRKSNTV